MTINNTNTVGFNPDSPRHLLLNSGAIYTNYSLVDEKLFGCCSPGNEFDVAIKKFDVKVGGITNTNVKGLSFITDITASLKINLLEMTTETISTSLMGSVVDTTTDPNYDIITLPMNGGGGITYINNIALVTTLSGSNLPVVIILKNALSSSGIKIKCDDGKNNDTPVVFEAYSDPMKPKESPFEIHYPKLTSMVSPFNMTAIPVIDNGKVLLTFNSAVEATIPKDGFIVTVAGVTDVITACTRGVNNINTILLTLTTIPTSGQVVTVTYTKPVTVPTQATSLENVDLESFIATNVVNN